MLSDLEICALSCEAIDADRGLRLHHPAPPPEEDDDDDDDDRKPGSGGGNIDPDDDEDIDDEDDDEEDETLWTGAVALESAASRDSCAIDRGRRSADENNRRPAARRHARW
jgi:hypothetical protein